MALLRLGRAVNLFDLAAVDAPVTLGQAMAPHLLMHACEQRLGGLRRQDERQIEQRGQDNHPGGKTEPIGVQSGCHRGACQVDAHCVMRKNRPETAWRPPAAVPAGVF